MNLRPLFHVSPSSKAPPAGAPVQAAPPQRMPSLVDVDIDFVDDPEPRGRSYETWWRARGWASED